MVNDGAGTSGKGQPPGIDYPTSGHRCPKEPGRSKSDGGRSKKNGGWKKRPSRLLKNSFGCHCDPAFGGGSNLIHNKIKHFEIAASLTLLAMTARIEFFRKLLI
jgi:hypothetical protein